MRKSLLTATAGIYIKNNLHKYKFTEVKSSYGIDLVSAEEILVESYDGVVHQQFLELDLKSIVHEDSVIYDIKSLLPKEPINHRL